MVTLTRRLPDGEIPTPNILPVMFSCTERSVPDVAEKCLSDQAVNDILLPRAGILGFLMTCSKIRDTRRDPVESGLIVRERQVLYALPFLDVTGAQDLGAAPAFTPRPAVLTTNLVRQVSLRLVRCLRSS